MLLVLDVYSIKSILLFTVEEQCWI